MSSSNGAIVDGARATRSMDQCRRHRTGKAKKKKVSPSLKSLTIRIVEVVFLVAFAIPAKLRLSNPQSPPFFVPPCHVSLQSTRTCVSACVSSFGVHNIYPICLNLLLCAVVLEVASVRITSLSATSLRAGVAVVIAACKSNSSYCTLQVINELPLDCPRKCFNRRQPAARSPRALVVDQMGISHCGFGGDGGR